MKKRTYRRIRSITLLIILVFIITSFINNLNIEEDVYTRDYLYTVLPHDTLWDIAKSFNYNNVDIRQIVYEIKENNELSDGNIYPGQTLIIPITYTVQDSKSIEVVFNN